MLTLLRRRRHRNHLMRTIHVGGGGLSVMPDTRTAGRQAASIAVRRSGSVSVRRLITRSGDTLAKASRSPRSFEPSPAVITRRGSRPPVPAAVPVDDLTNSHQPWSPRSRNVAHFKVFQNAPTCGPACRGAPRVEVGARSAPDRRSGSPPCTWRCWCRAVGTADGPIGITLPAVVTGGTVRTAANIDRSWIGGDAIDLFAKATGRDRSVRRSGRASIRRTRRRLLHPQPRRSWRIDINRRRTSCSRLDCK